MFKRLFFDTWDGWIPLLGFGLTAAAFLLILIRTLRMTKGESARLARLPLEDHHPYPEDHHGH